MPSVRPVASSTASIAMPAGKDSGSCKRLPAAIGANSNRSPGSSSSAGACSGTLDLTVVIQQYARRLEPGSIHRGDPRLRRMARVTQPLHQATRRGPLLHVRGCHDPGRTPGGVRLHRRASTANSAWDLPAGENRSTDRLKLATQTPPSFGSTDTRNGTFGPNSTAANACPSAPTLSNRLLLPATCGCSRTATQATPLRGSTSTLDAHQVEMSTEQSTFPLSAVILVSFRSAIQNAFAFRS